MFAARLLLLVALANAAPAPNKNFLLANFTCVEGGGAIRNDRLHENLDRQNKISVGAANGPWERRLRNGDVQTLRACQYYGQTPTCDKWVDKNGKTYASGVTVADKGRTIILYHNNAVLADSGEYIVPGTNNRSFSVIINVTPKTN